MKVVIALVAALLVIGGQYLPSATSSVDLGTVQTHASAR